MIISFTGHRPHWKPDLDKLGTGYSISNDRVQAYVQLLRNTLVPLITEEGADTFYSGGAIGWDQIAFWTVEYLKLEYPHIRNILAVPFKKQYTNWRSDEIVTWYHKMVQRADHVVYVDEQEGYISPVPVGEYSAQKLQTRNEYMVDYSHVLISLWNGSSGGTGNCVKYAQKQGKRIIRLHPLVF
jgi:uncharacterized phage-like protein YoqJ